MFAAVAVALALQVSPTGAVDPASPEGAAVMAPINATFAALAARDGSLLLPHLDEEARMTAVVEPSDGGPMIRRISGADFAGSLRPGAQALEEVMPDPFVAIDGDVAVVWGRYVFRIDGALSHCGSNHFDMVRRDGVWKIAAITWNQTKEGCDGIAAD